MIDPIEKERKKRKEQFPAYLASLRSGLNKSLADICEDLKTLFPISPDYYMHPSQLHDAEKGKRELPAEKIEGLAKVYGIPYEKLMFEAGLLPDDLSAGPQKWGIETLRDYYFSRLAETQQIKAPTEHEKRLIEVILSQVLQRSGTDKSKDIERINKAFLNHYIGYIMEKFKLKSLSADQVQKLSKFIDEFIITFGEK